MILVGAGRRDRRGAGDRTLGLPPLNERLARRMLESLRIWPLLRGHRGRPAVDLDALLEVVIRFSYLVADYPEIDEMEINPLLATAEGAVALDARAIVDQALAGTSARPLLAPGDPPVSGGVHGQARPPRPACR